MALSTDNPHWQQLADNHRRMALGVPSAVPLELGEDAENR